MPFAVAEEGYDGVDGVEDGVERNAFVPVKAGADRIDHDPGYPLLKVFAGEHPHADYAHGCSEGIGNGDGAVGEIIEDEIETYPQDKEDRHAYEEHAWGDVGDGSCGVVGLWSCGVVG